MVDNLALISAHGALIIFLYRVLRRDLADQRDAELKRREALSAQRAAKTQARLSGKL
ncbi:MAG: hypothetical protein WA906_01595 [Pacificimonas sp.]